MSLTAYFVNSALLGCKNRESYPTNMTIQVGTKSTKADYV